MSTNYTRHVNPRAKSRKTPQSEVIPGKENLMAQNNAGAFAFVISDWDRLDRFLILGSEGNTYYVSEKKLTQDNAAAVQRCIDSDGVRVVNRIVEISDAGRAPKNDPALFALALCTAAKDENTRRAAIAALPKVARIGTHLFHFAEFVQAFRGWGRALRNGVASWYNEKDLNGLILQLVKYKSRDGWSHRDLLRLAHPKADTDERSLLYKWVVSPDTVKEQFTGLQPQHPFARVEAAVKLATEKDAANAIKLVKQFRLPREVLNTELLKHVSVWEALLDEMPVTAMIRNLGKMTSVGLLKPLSAASRKVCETLTNQEAIQKARVHPLAILVAMNVYKQGRGEKGSLTWTPDQSIVNALDKAFYLAFKNVTPTGKRWLLGVDISGSMNLSEIAGMTGVTPRIGAAAMTLMTMASESQVYPLGFTKGSYRSMHVGYPTGLTPLDISPRQRLDTVINYMNGLPLGGTDCALPMIHAAKEKLEVDAFVVYTDNETWAGDIHPVQALKQYRDKMGIPAKLIVVGMTATQFSIADPSDAGMLDVVGFDTAAPEIMADFVRGA